MTWLKLPFFSSETFKRIESELDNCRKSGRIVLPENQNIFRALQLVKPNDVKVLILGQDPYPNIGHPNGLAFSVNPDVKPLPRSLQNIFKELVSDTGCEYPVNGDLTPWAKQGVLLLNTSLTVIAGEPNSHSKLGWSELISDIIKEINEQAENRKIAAILWGLS